MAENLQIEKISQLPENFSPFVGNDELIVNRYISPGVFKTRRAKYSSIFPQRESDFQTPYLYCAYAPAGSLTSQAVWEIERITVNLDGTVLVQSASNVAWDNRYTVIYT